ncbi:uncharacterized protein AAEQ78_021910 [Lycaon pictus]
MHRSHEVQLLQMLFEEAQPHRGPDPVLVTLSLVQLSPSGRTQDLLSPGTENLSVLNVSPLGLVVEDASEVEVSDSRAASELYLQAAGDECRDCPLLQVLAGRATGEEVEGSLPWIVSRLLEGNNYSGLLLRLDPQALDLPLLGGSLSLLWAALLGAEGRRMQVKQVRPILWDAVEEARAHRAGLKSLRSGLLGDNLTDSGLSQLGRALRELQVSKVRPGGARESNSWSVSGKAIEDNIAHIFQLGLSPKAVYTYGLLTWAWQAPDVALQFFLAQARKKRWHEWHQIRIQEELKHLEQEKVAGDQVKGLEAEKEVALNKEYVLSLKDSEERQRWHREQRVLRLQLEALQAEKDNAEQDLVALYELHVQAARAQTRHTLQVFRTWRRLWEEQAVTTEHHHRSLLAGVLQDNINLATQNQELRAQNQQLRQGID